MILTSPARRARETAEILAGQLGGILQIDRALGSPFDADHLLSRILPGETTFLVGHDPTLASFANLLLGEKAFTGLEKSCALIITFPERASYGEGLVADYLKSPS